MRILLSNDDGVHATGLRILYEELSKIADVWVVAPLEERSTTGHSLTIHRPLRLIHLKGRYFGVQGSPADCVIMGLSQVMKAKPDFVVSGINRGPNLGQDVYYSGTVSVAREACILGIPSLAVSLATDLNAQKTDDRLNFRSAAGMTRKMLNEMRKMSLPFGTFLNLNVPDLPLSKIKGVKLGQQGYRIYDGRILKRKDHRGQEYFWIGGKYQGFRGEEMTDCAIVDSSFASLTPIKLDATDYVFMASVAKTWGSEVMVGKSQKNRQKNRQFKKQLKK